MNAVRSVMHRLALVIVAVCLALFCLTGFALAQENSGDGAVYVLTNLAQGNTVVVFHRNSDGSLTRVEEVATGGLGSGPSPIGPVEINSADSLVLTEDARFLLAVNSKSNDVSVFAVNEDGRLKLVDRAATDGNFPVSIAHKGRLVYVLNEGESPDLVLGGVPNVTGFVLGNTGKLHKIPNSTRAVGSPDSGPSDISFSRDGRFLITTEMFTSLIKVWAVDDDGIMRETSAIRASNHTPLAIALGHHNVVLTTEGDDEGNPPPATRSGTPNAATVTSYRLNDNGTLELIDHALALATGTCWIRFTPDLRFAFTGDTGSGTITRLSVSRDGGLTLLGHQSTDIGGRKSVPIDLTITPDGRFLYSEASLLGMVEGFRIEEDGSLTPVGNVSGLPISTEGIASR